MIWLHDTSVNGLSLSILVINHIAPLSRDNLDTQYPSPWNAVHAYSPLDKWQ